MLRNKQKIRLRIIIVQFLIRKNGCRPIMDKTNLHSALNSADDKFRNVEGKHTFLIGIFGVVLLVLVFIGLFLTLVYRFDHPLSAPFVPPLAPSKIEPAIPIKVARRPEAIREDAEKALKKFNYQIRNSPYFRTGNLSIPRVHLVDFKDNVAFLDLENGDVVASQMGSHGAVDYFKRLRHALTGIEGLYGFKIPAEEGDHLDEQYDEEGANDSPLNLATDNPLHNEVADESSLTDAAGNDAN